VYAQSVMTKEVTVLVFVYVRNSTREVQFLLKN